jgi:hypothetical protein
MAGTVKRDKYKGKNKGQIRTQGSEKGKKDCHIVVALST